MNDKGKSIILLILILFSIKLNALTQLDPNNFEYTRYVSESICNTRFSILSQATQEKYNYVSPMSYDANNGTCSFYGNANNNGAPLGFFDYSITQITYLYSYFSSSYIGFNSIIRNKIDFPDDFDSSGNYIPPCTGVKDNDGFCCTSPNVIFSGQCSTGTSWCSGIKSDFPPVLLGESNGVPTISCTDEPQTCQELENLWASSCGLLGVNSKGTCKEETVGLSYPPSLKLVNNFRCYDSSSQISDLEISPLTPTLNQDNLNDTTTTDSSVNQLNQLKNNQETAKNTNELLKFLSDTNRISGENTVKTLQDQTQTLDSSLQKLNKTNEEGFNNLIDSIDNFTGGFQDDTLLNNTLNSDSLNNIESELTTFYSNISSSYTDMIGQYDNIMSVINQGKTVNIPTYSDTGCFKFDFGGKSISISPCELPINIKSVVQTLLSSFIYILFLILSFKMFLNYGLPVLRGGN